MKEKEEGREGRRLEKEQIRGESPQTEEKKKEKEKGEGGKTRNGRNDDDYRGRDTSPLLF